MNECILVAACKRRWKNIRDNYYKYKKTSKQPTGSAAFGNRKRNPILDQLRFLDTVEHERRWAEYFKLNIFIKQCLTLNF